MFKKLKSIETDFSLFQQLIVINKNVLYVTNQVDKILKLLNDLKINQQSLDYYENKELESVRQPEEIKESN